MYVHACKDVCTLCMYVSLPYCIWIMQYRIHACTREHFNCNYLTANRMGSQPDLELVSGGFQSSTKVGLPQRSRPNIRPLSLSDVTINITVTSARFSQGGGDDRLHCACWPRLATNDRKLIASCHQCIVILLNV